MKALVLVGIPFIDPDTNEVLGDKVAQTSDTEFDVCPDFIWVDIDSTAFDQADLLNPIRLYHSNGVVSIHTPIVPGPTDPDPSITDSDLL